MPRLAKIERKVEYFPIIGGEIKATNDAKGIVEGYLNYIGNIDFGDDRTMPGAFKKTLSDSYARKSAQDLDYLWPYLWNHDYNIIPPGGIFEANEDRKGLYVKVQLNLEYQLGRELYSSFKAGTVKKQSMGYKAIQVDWVKETGKGIGINTELGYTIKQFEWVKENGRSIRNLLEVAVMEGSAVVFPMNDLAQVDTVKNRRNFYMPTLREMGAKIAPSREKGNTMDIYSKDYAADYLDATQADWCTDLWNLWYPLRNAIVQAFVVGDTPAEDVQAALDQFNAATLNYVKQGIALNMTDYLQPADEDDNPGPMPMMMSSDDNPETKDAKLLSAASHAKMTKSIDGAITHLKEAKSELSRQRANALQGYQVYSLPADNLEQKEEEENPPEQKEEQVEDVHSVLHDLTLLLSADNANRGV